MLPQKDETTLKTHAAQLAKLVDRLEAEGIPRDVALYTSLHRFPAYHQQGRGIADELAAMGPAPGTVLDPEFLGEVSKATYEIELEYSKVPSEPETRAALAAALGREDSTLTTPDLVAALVAERDHYRQATRARDKHINALGRQHDARAKERDAAANERDTLINREGQMRARCLEALPTVSDGSTLDLVKKLAGELKVAKAEIADYPRLREHNLQLQALVSKVRAAVS